MTSPRGIALIDLVVACGLIALIGVTAVPSLQTARERDAARLAARYVAARMASVRIDALRRNRNVALRFDPADPNRMAIYADGDGDGVLQADIDAGIDPLIAPPFHLADLFGDASFRVAWTVPSPDGATVIPAGADPVRIGNTNLLSFSPLGSATGGSLYVAGAGGTQLCLRVLGATGRVRVLRFDPASNTWRQD